MSLTSRIMSYHLCIIQVEGYSFCHWSRITAEIVTSCPANKQEIKERAQLKNCERYALNQNCTERHNFKYHCVMNENEQAYFELCAAEYIIHGTCISTG